MRQTLGLGFQVLGIQVLAALWYRVQGLGLRVQGSDLRVQGSNLERRVQGLGFSA